MANFGHFENLNRPIQRGLHWDTYYQVRKRSQPGRNGGVDSGGSVSQ
jgi:hypothetical protein